MLTWIIVILLVLWLVGAFGPGISSRIPRSGNAIHTLLVIVVILIILNLLNVI
ncbi:MAG: lmo0937 family membrane protein [Anaerolineae bacterium]|nr:MAG: lmo0937 family membrane protein [Anaerolineae bacterium]